MELYGVMCQRYEKLENQISYELVTQMVERIEDIALIEALLNNKGIILNRTYDGLAIAMDSLKGGEHIPVDIEYLLIIEMRKNNPVAIEIGWLMCSQYLNSYRDFFEKEFNKENLFEMDDAVEYTMIMLYENIMTKFNLFFGRSFFSYAMSIAKYNMFELTGFKRDYISTARKENSFLINQNQVVNFSDSDEISSIWDVADEKNMENDLITETALCDAIDYIMQVLDEIEIPYCRTDAPKEAIRLLYYKGDTYFFKSSNSSRGINWTKLSRDIGTCKERSLKKHTLALFDILKAECISRGMNVV